MSGLMHDFRSDIFLMNDILEEKIGIDPKTFDFCPSVRPDSVDGIIMDIAKFRLLVEQQNNRKLLDGIRRELLRINSVIEQAMHVKPTMAQQRDAAKIERIRNQKDGMVSRP